MKKERMKNREKIPDLEGEGMQPFQRFREPFGISLKCKKNVALPAGTESSQASSNSIRLSLLVARGTVHLREDGRKRKREGREREERRGKEEEGGKEKYRGDEEVGGREVARGERRKDGRRMEGKIASVGKGGEAGARDMRNRGGRNEGGNKKVEEKKKEGGSGVGRGKKRKEGEEKWLAEGRKEVSLRYKPLLSMGGGGTGVPFLNRKGTDREAGSLSRRRTTISSGWCLLRRGTESRLSACNRGRSSSWPKTRSEPVMRKPPQSRRIYKRQDEGRNWSMP